jgi:hypothetical protein
MMIEKQPAIELLARKFTLDLLELHATNQCILAI